MGGDGDLCGSMRWDDPTAESVDEAVGEFTDATRAPDCETERWRFFLVLLIVVVNYHNGEIGEGFVEGREVNELERSEI